MQTNQQPQKRKVIKETLSRFFSLNKKTKSNDLSLEEWERIEMRKPTIQSNSFRGLS